MLSRSFRFRVYPTSDQEPLLRRTIGCTRFVYNKALAECKSSWALHKKSVGYLAMSRALTEWKKQETFAFLREVSCAPLQQSLRHLQTAYTNFFKSRANPPTFIRLVRENQVIAVEDLSIANMLRNRGLARVISDAGWYELFRQLAYKSAWYGRTLVKIDRFHPSSKMCSCCRHILDQLPLDVRRWTCPACQTEHDRDVNAARNILAAGLAVSACGPDVRQRILQSMLLLGMKQENSSAPK